MAAMLQHIRHTWDHTRKGRVVGALLVVFALVNGFVYLSHRQQTYGSTAVNGQQVGSVSLSELPEKLQDMPLLPKSFRLTYEGKPTVLTPAELGMEVDADQTAEQLIEQRSPLPVANYFTAHEAELSVKVDPKVYGARINAIGKAYRREAANASLQLRAGDFIITPEQEALAIDSSGTQSRIVDALTAGRSDAEIMMKRTPPAVTRASLEPRLQTLQARRNTAVSLTFETRTKRFTADEIGSWFVPQPADADGFAIADNRLADAVSDTGLELGVRVTNAAATAAAIRQAVDTRQPASLPLAGNPLDRKAYTYCTAVRGVPSAEIAALDSKADSVLNAKRGWSLGGNVSFTKAAADAGSCDFTLWLASADQMPSFGAICDILWSCAVTPNVVVNYDRWRGASEAWNRDGGTLEDYRVMVINHEVGHWLGFNHSSCPAPGLPAPVMQQQSINLQGCSFSPWPSSTERTALRDFLGL